MVDDVVDAGQEELVDDGLLHPGNEVVLPERGEEAPSWPLLGPEPGQVLVYVKDLELDTEIQGWYDLGVRIGDGVILLIPRPVGDGTMEPVLERFIVTGVFEAGLQDHDSILALVNTRDAAEILGLGDEATAVRFRAHDVMAAPAVSKRLMQRLDGVTASDWTVENASYFRAIRLEKMMMSLILSLIIGVAAFNIVASLVMVVTDKTNDIAILRTLGMGPNGVVRVFFVQGAMIGWAGVLFGVALGVASVVCIQTLNQGALAAFGGGMKAVSGDADLTDRPYERNLFAVFRGGECR